MLRFQELVPPIAADAETLLPAEEYLEERFNVEVTELYAVFPFRKYTFYKDHVEIAKKPLISGLSNTESWIALPLEIRPVPQAAQDGNIQAL